MRDLIQLVLIYGNQHLLSGLTAVENYQKQFGLNQKTVIIYRQNWLNIEKFEHFTELSREILRNYNAKFIAITEEDWIKNSGKISQLIDLDPDNIDVEEIFFPHNLVSNTIDCLRLEFPSAKLICFGDGLGMVFSKLSYKSARFQGPYRLIFRQLNKYKIMHKMRFIQEYCLILPINHSRAKKLLTKMEIPQKSSVLSLSGNLCAEIKNKMKEFVEKYLDSNSVVLCLENFAEVGLLTPEKEIELFAELINHDKFLGKNIYIKSHPMQENSKFERLNESLKNFSLGGLPDYLNEIPLELWPFSEFKGRLVSVGAAALSIRFLYGIEVENPLNVQMIEKYFEPELWHLIKNDQDLMNKPVFALASWNGKSVLYENE